MACTLPTWAINQHAKKIEECNFQCVNQQQGERGSVRYPLDEKERQIFQFSGLYSRIQPMKSTNKSTHETNQLSDTIIIIYLKKITIQVKSTYLCF